MASTLPRAPESFCATFTVGRHRTFPIYFGRLKMASALKPNGGRLSMSFNGGQISTVSAKAETKRNGGENSLDEGPQGGLCDDDANVNKLENGKTVNIWWDFGRCPLPLNFDAPKIASNITKAIHRLGMRGGPIYLHAYGNIYKTGEDIVRFASESGLQMIGFKLKDYCDDEENVDLMRDLMSHPLPPPAIHIIISDGRVYSNCCLGIHLERGYTIVTLEPPSLFAY